MIETSETPEPGGEGSALARSGLLQDGPKLKDDMRLVARAARLGWGVPKELKEQTIKRLGSIVAKTAVTIAAGEAGAVAAEYPADQNAIAAARALAALDGIDQTDHWNADKNDRLDSGKATERVGVGDIVTRRPVTVDPTALPETGPENDKSLP